MPKNWRCLFLATSALVLSGCGWDGHFNLFGYTTRPNYDTSIKTVCVPMFKNIIFRDLTRQGLEYDLTRAVVREIEAKTPYKVVNSEASADTVLNGKILNLTKSVINQNQIGEVREAQTILTVEIVWKDLRPGHLGEFLSQQRQGGTGAQPPGALPPGPLPPGTVPPGPLPPGTPPPEAITPGGVVVTSYGTYIPEVGGSNLTSYQLDVDRMAIQIVSMMELWPAPAPVPPPGP